MVSRLVVVVHVMKVQNAPRPVRFGRVNAYLGASSCHQHGECVPPRRRELRRRPVVQVHITILVVRLGNATFEKPLRSRSPNSSRLASTTQASSGWEVATATSPRRQLHHAHVDGHATRARRDHRVASSLNHVRRSATTSANARRLPSNKSPPASKSHRAPSAGKQLQVTAQRDALACICTNI